jgi:hypothetical protein
MLGEANRTSEFRIVSGRPNSLISAFALQESVGNAFYDRSVLSLDWGLVSRARGIDRLII